MKKVLTLITILILTFSFNVFAMEYKTVTVTATFTEEINFADIEKIELIIFGEGIDYVDDAASVLNIIELTQENNYTKSINDTRISDLSNLFAMVNKDKYGVYNCEITLDSSVADKANIMIHVSKNDIPKNEFSEIPSEIIDRIIGKDASNNNSKNENNISGDNNSNEENEITVGTTTTKPTTTTNEVIYREELKKREKEERDKKKNNFISLILYVIIGIILFVGLLFVTYKFINANK